MFYLQKRIHASADLDRARAVVVGVSDNFSFGKHNLNSASLSKIQILATPVLILLVTILITYSIFHVVCSMLTLSTYGMHATKRTCHDNTR